jgi:predicted ribosome quality control (RQC) complex YloA/Tae2 family protein
VLSLRELERAVALLDGRLRGARLDKVVQPDEYRLVLSFRDAGHVLLSCRPGAARLSQVAERPQGARTPPPFLAFLRKRIGRATCTGVRCVAGDRQAALTLRGKEGEVDLLLSILGPRSNIYLIDADGILLQSLRPLGQTRRVLALGEAWRNPESPPPQRGEDRFAGVADEAFFAALEEHYERLERGEDADQDARRLRQALAKERKGLQRRLAALRRDLEAAGEADGLRRQGELLKAQLDRVSAGAEEVELEDFETGERVRVPLDPTLSARENLEALFKRYRKRVRSAEPVAAQIAEVEAQLAENAALAQELEAAGDDPEALAALAGRGEVARRLARFAPRPPPARARTDRRKGRADLPARLRPRRYATAGGLEVWVGRSDEGNDHLTLRLARGNDLFLHLDGSPGSHVVLRTQGRNDPPPDALLDAAELAVHFSKQRNATRADVHVVPIKNVSKPRGAKPGLVYVTGGRSVHLRRDPERLRRVLEARVDDTD